MPNYITLFIGILFAKRWMQQYDPGYEKFFPVSTDGKLPDRPKVNSWGYPGLVELQDSVFMLITEANIRRGHCGSLLFNGDNNDRYQVKLADKKQVAERTWVSPWRVLIIGGLSDIVESTLVTDVSDPSKVEYTEWINPGMVSWIYWAYNHGSKDYQKVKEYIDLAAEMHWPYNLIDWEWDEMSNGGNLQDAVKYTLNKGIKPLLWYNSSTNWIGPGPLFRLNKKQDREKEYAWLSEMGIAGIKVDFFSGDSVSTMNYYIDLLEDAIKYKLMLNFHGATIPRGWQRTYPHMMSIEGVYGAEWYNNAPILTNRAAEHNATLPFTRNVVGPMDYTPGTFSNSQHPHITSYAHELALPVIFESALQHMPDRPSVYYGLPEPVKRLLSELPVAWDDTKLLTGEAGYEISGSPGRPAVGTACKDQCAQDTGDHTAAQHGNDQSCIQINNQFTAAKKLHDQTADQTIEPQLDHHDRHISENGHTGKQTGYQRSENAADQTERCSTDQTAQKHGQMHGGEQDTALGNGVQSHGQNYT